MCGFSGIFTRRDPLDLQTRLKSSSDRIQHRGPDDASIWMNAENTGGLAFRRLAIQDLSPAGRQPMATSDQRLAMVFNGEIYNHLKLRAALTEPAGGWRGHSDSETILQAFSEWGIERSLDEIEGMFAIALWDEEASELHLVRDRFGEKPLYYRMDDKSVAFASELKALQPLMPEPFELDPDGLAAFFRLRYIPAPGTIYKGVGKLLPGEHLTVKFSPQGVKHESRRYWDSAVRAKNSIAEPFEGTQEEAIEEIDRLLLTSMEGRLLSDVPLGAFLSGGIDSSLTVAIAQQVSSAKLNSYTIRFEDPKFDESLHAREVAHHLGTDHHEITVNADDALQLVDSLPDVYDEPFADPSQLPTMLICAKAKQHVTVALSGDGGDEFFAGYSRYRRISDKWAGQEKSLFKDFWAGAACLPWQGLGSQGLKLKRRLRNWSAHSLIETAQFEAGFWRDGIPVKGWNKGARGFFPALWSDPESGSFLMRQMVMDAGCYLPDDLQVKTDRAAMAVSLEVRTPFLNKDLADFCWRLPDHLLWPEQGQSKNLLRELAYKYVPKQMLDRPKQGFDVPVREWLRGPLAEWGRDLVMDDASPANEWLQMDMIRNKWRWHQRGTNFEGDLWPALIMLSWMKRWKL